MKRKPTPPKGTPVARGRWPGASPATQRRATLTKRSKTIKVTLAGSKDMRS
jgi:hypothetical protein